MATKNIFDILSDHSDDEEGTHGARGSKNKGKQYGKKEDKPLADDNGKEKVDSRNYKQPVRDDRHSRNGPTGNNKNALKQGGAGSLNVGNLDNDLKGADSYAAKEIVAGDKGRAIESPVVDNSITLKEYYQQNGMKLTSETEEAPAPVAIKIDTEALKKEKLTLIQRQVDIVDDRDKGKNKQKADPTNYRVGFSSSNVELLGFKSGWKYEEERPKKREFAPRDEKGEDKKTEESAPATTEATATTTTPATTETTTTTPATTEVAEGADDGNRRGNRRGNEKRGGDGERKGGEGRGGDRGGDRRGPRGNDNRGGDRKFNNDGRRGAPRGTENNTKGGGRGKKEFTGAISNDDFPSLD